MNVDLKATPLKRSIKTSFTNLILAKYCKKNKLYQMRNEKGFTCGHHNIIK